MTTQPTFVFNVTNNTSRQIDIGSNPPIPAYTTLGVNWVSVRANNQIVAGNVSVSPTMLEPTSATSPYMGTSSLVSGTSTLAQVTTEVILLRNLVASMYNNMIDREAGSTEGY